MAVQALLCTVCAAEIPPEDRKVLLTRATSLTVMAVVLIVVVGVLGVMLLRRHRRWVLERGPRGTGRRRRLPKDPWFESARRLGTGAKPPGSDDDTVDLDPDDIEPGDIEGQDDKGDGGDKP